MAQAQAFAQLIFSLGSQAARKARVGKVFALFVLLGWIFRLLRQS